VVGSSWCASGPVGGGLSGLWGGSLVGQQVDSSLPGPSVYGDVEKPSMGRGSGCRSFSFPWCFTSAKCVSSVSARSLIPRAHAVCVCVPVTILDPSSSF
jgi:hypothetical protein